MRKYLRYLLYAIGYTILFAVIPLAIFLGTDVENAAVIFIYFLIVVFLTLGFILFYTVLRDSSPKEDKRLAEKLGDIEIQNAAIAFSLSELKKELRGGKDKFGQ